jgi:Kef-type K+ transport system membrane component KefB
MDALVQLALIWAGVLLAAYLARRTRLTPVLYFLAVGSVFVNLGLLPEQPHEFIRGFAEIGIILIMFALGFEEQAGHFLQSVKRSWGIAFFGALGPFMTAYFLADYFWGDYHMSLMCGLAMTATAVSLTMVTLRGEGLQTSKAATRIMTSAILDDIASLALVAILIPVASGDAMPSATSVGLTVIKATMFFLIVSALGMWVFPHPLKGWLNRVPFISHFGIRHLLAFEDGEYATLIILLLALGVGLLSHTFGFHPAVGAYMAGLVLREEYFTFTSSNHSIGYQETKRIVDNVAFSWIGPVFFVVLGTQLVLEWDIVISVIPYTAAFTLGLMIVQVVSAGLAARYTSGMPPAASFLIGLGMLGRAELAFVVLNIAYVQHKILSEEAFYTLMFTAFWLNVAVPISIRWWKPYYLKEVHDNPTHE